MGPSSRTRGEESSTKKGDGCSRLSSVDETSKSKLRYVSSPHSRLSRLPSRTLNLLPQVGLVLIVPPSRVRGRIRAVEPRVSAISHERDKDCTLTDQASGALMWYRAHARSSAPWKCSNPGASLGCSSSLTCRDSSVVSHWRMRVAASASVFVSASLDMLERRRKVVEKAVGPLRGEWAQRWSLRHDPSAVLRERRGRREGGMREVEI